MQLPSNVVAFSRALAVNIKDVRPPPLAARVVENNPIAEVPPKLG
eukprot:CAMPEP_0169419100 /NCGR_PEP_ID=MMETSP1017-20121227/64768_1 /TAXON_ID=342587 /ORGANISM="Karlodinium micrum, Strain CCMP2283" /LENGTH=44 /DNA_ID= /DNA_START= /DNA_END= /DNA_ORIENTATION=